MTNFFWKVVLIALVFQAGSTHADNIYWRGNSPIDPTSWTDPLNWDNSTVPNADDHALVHDFGAAQYGFPVIRTDVGSVNYLTPSWHPVESTLTVVAGGFIAANNLILGQGAGPASRGVLDQQGGEVYARILWVGFDGNGEVLLKGGLLTAWELSMGGQFGAGTGLIDLSGGTLVVAGDRRELFADFIADNWIVAYGGSGRVVWDYSLTNPGHTTLRGVPDMRLPWGPTPPVGRPVLFAASDTVSLAWEAGDNVQAYDVYFGSDLDQVQNADLDTSPTIYLGRTASTEFPVPEMESDTEYFWRVDPVQDETPVLTGEVWNFDLGVPTQVDLDADTWVATDALDRSLPEQNLTGTPREDRLVVMYYLVWLGHHGTPGPYNVTEIVETNPADPAFVDNQAHFWDEPEVDYFLSDDRWVIRRDLAMLEAAGVDVLVIETTNGFPYVQEAQVVLDVLHEMRTEGFASDMKFCFWTHAYSPQVVETYYESIYSLGLFRDDWFHLNGKPLMLGYPDGVPSDNPQISVSPEIRDFFTWRECWAWTHGQHKWQFVDQTPQDWAWDESPDFPEQVVVSTSSHPTLNLGKSYQNFTQPPLNELDLPVGGTEGWGIQFLEQFERAFMLAPRIMYFTEWNEWIAGAFVRNDGDPPVNFLGEPVQVGENYFVDQYNREYNRDIAPSRDGYTDNYYYQLVDFSRRHRGITAIPQASAARNIAIDADFADWEGVGPVFRDVAGDTEPRRHLGWGVRGMLHNNTGRNDLIEARVARDGEYLYFQAATRDDLTAPSDPNWMLLFIDSDQDHNTGWEGYDFLVNYAGVGATTRLRRSTDGWNWELVQSGIPYAVNGNQLELRLPRAALGQGSGDDPVALDFHWADNIQVDDDIREFFIHGDSAPDRRFNYRYQTRYDQRTVLIDEGFEDGTTTWGDWDNSTASPHTGQYALECSADDNDGMIVGTDTSGFESFRLSFYSKQQSVGDADNYLFWYNDGTAWNQIAELGIHDDNVWLYHTDVRSNTGTDVRFFTPNLVFHLQGSELRFSTQRIWLDDVLLEAWRPLGQAAQPYPPDGAENVPVDVTLGWTAGWGAEAHNVYLGAATTALVANNLTDVEQYKPVQLEYETTYYWRVDEQTDSGVVSGPLWTFTTGKEIVPVSQFRLY